METEAFALKKLANNPPVGPPQRPPPTLPRKSPARAKVTSLEKPLPPIPTPESPSEMPLLTPPLTNAATHIQLNNSADVNHSLMGLVKTETATIVNDMSLLSLSVPPNSAVTSPTLLVTPTESDSVPALVDGDTTPFADVPVRDHTRHLKRRSMLHRPYEGVKLASELESVRVVSYERREDGCFWYTLHVTPKPRYLPPPPKAPRIVMRPQPYAIYRIYEDFVELSIRLAYTFNLDVSSARPLAPLLESFTRAQQRNANVPFDMMDQLDCYVARLVASDQQVQQSRPMREFFGIWRSDVNYKLSRSIVDPLARTFAQRTTLPNQNDQEDPDHLDARWSSIATAGSRTPPMSGRNVAANSSNAYSNDESTTESTAEAAASSSSSPNTSPTFRSPLTPQLKQSIRQLQRNTSVNKLVQRAKTVLVRSRAPSDTREIEEEVAAVAAASTLRQMQNGAAGVVAIAAPWNQTGASPSASPSSAMPRLIRLGSLNTIPRQLDSSITSAAPWNRKFSHDDTEYRPRMSEETARMAADWRVESVGLSRSQSLMNREEQSVKATRVLPPVKANDRRKKLESITGSEADAPTPEAAANEPTSPKLSNDGSNGMNRTPEPVTVKKQLSAELLNILSETKSNEETQQPQYAGSAIAAVAMRVNGEHDTANSDPEAIRKPLVQAIALAGLRRKRTLEQLKQGQNEEETATTATIVEPDTSDITEKEAETEAITRGGNKEATKRKMTIDTKATVSTASVQQLATQHVHEIESPQPKPKTIALPTMNSLRSQLPIFSPLSPQIPITPYTGTSTPPANTSNVTDIPVFNDTSDILSSNASWRSRSADSSPVNLIHSTPIQSSKMITSMTSTLLTKPTTPTTATTTATTAYDGKDATGTDAETSSRALTGLLRHHRSQPGIRDSVLIRRTDSIAPRPTQAQLARARTIAHSPNNTFIARRNKARQAALDVSMPSSIASPTSILPEVGLVDVKVVLDKTRLIKVQIPRHITYDELRTRIDDKFKRCGHGDQATKDRILVYRESNADGAIVRIEGDFALGVVLFECPERVTFFAV